MGAIGDRHGTVRVRTATVHLEDARRIVPGIPAVVMSGYAPDAVAGRFGATEGVMFLQKPFTIGDLVGAVHRALETVAATG